jgi:putative transposase
VKRGFRYRTYLTAEQESLSERSCGVSRLVHNVSLEQRSLAYRLTGRSVGWAAQDAEWVALKKDPEFAWLSEVHSDVISQALRDLDGAFQKFFAGKAGYPRPHRKGERDSFRLCQRRARDRRSGRVYVSIEVRRLSRRWAEVKLPKLGWVRIRYSRSLEGEIRNATLMRTALGWEVSLCVEDGLEPAAAREFGPAVGVDAGVVVSFATSGAELYQVPSASRGECQRRLRLERRLARQRKGSAGRERTKRQLARVRARDARRRQDYLHNLTTRLAGVNALVAIEDLRVKNMTRSARGTVEQPGVNVAQKAGLNRSILAQGWGEFRRQLEYKTSERGCHLVAVPPAHTSDRCRCCGDQQRENRESQAVFRCLSCGHAEHADVHAARNILAAALDPERIPDTAAGLAVAARRALSVKDGDEARTPNLRAA